MEAEAFATEGHGISRKEEQAEAEISHGNKTNLSEPDALATV